MNGPRYVLDHASDGQPGTWRVGSAVMIPLGRGENVRAICPDCGCALDLSRHRIEENGDVTPGATCVNRVCGFSELISLDGWGADDMPAAND